MPPGRTRRDLIRLGAHHQLEHIREAEEVMGLMHQTLRKKLD